MIVTASKGSEELIHTRMASLQAFMEEKKLRAPSSATSARMAKKKKSCSSGFRRLQHARELCRLEEVSL